MDISSFEPEMLRLLKWFGQKENPTAIKAYFECCKNLTDEQFRLACKLIYESCDRLPPAKKFIELLQGTPEHRTAAYQEYNPPRPLKRLPGDTLGNIAAGIFSAPVGRSPLPEQSWRCLCCSDSGIVSEFVIEKYNLIPGYKAIDGYPIRCNRKGCTGLMTNVNGRLVDRVNPDCLDGSLSAEGCEYAHQQELARMQRLNAAADPSGHSIERWKAMADVSRYLNKPEILERAIAEAKQFGANPSEFSHGFGVALSCK